LSAGKIAGSGHAEVLQILNNKPLGLDFVVMKYFATLSSFVSTIPGGVFMPSISNEFPVLILVAIVILVVVKPF
jgi:H+/Cl- antiporter ClcA